MDITSSDCPLRGMMRLVELGRIPLSPAEAQKHMATLAQRVLDAISVPGDVAGQRYHGSASIGATLFRGDNTGKMLVRV